MLYNSLQFILFFIIITISYWSITPRFRWLLLLLASCYFYMVYIPSYIVIIGFTIVVDYIAGICIEQARNQHLRKAFLTVSLITNIGVLVFFKYFNLLNTALNNLLHHFNHHTPFPFLTFLLPIGLSFHTFQAMSYTIEVYKGNHKAERKFGLYALYVMFYPQLVAGPIERPQNILWQFHERKEYDFEKMKSGLMQMAFGMLKKVVIADRLSGIVDAAYAHPGSQTGFTLFIASILYSFQIYCDFSGYSDIGIGAARCMGFKLVDNFNVPYLSESFGEFWRKWHMSLSTWFRDYLYIPLGGNRVKPYRKYLNLMIVFLLSGLWHGANWTFVIWGCLHGIFIISEDLLGGERSAKQTQGLFLRGVRIAITFVLVTLAWIFFRSPDLTTAKIILQKIFSNSFFDGFNFNLANSAVLLFSFILIVVLMLKEHFYLTIPTRNTVQFYAIFILIVFVCYLFGVFNYHQFIYFKF